MADKPLFTLDAESRACRGVEPGPARCTTALPPEALVGKGRGRRGRPPARPGAAAGSWGKAGVPVNEKGAVVYMNTQSV